MKTSESINTSRSYAATVGFFDGFHTGHRYLVEQLKSVAAARNAGSMVVTFPQHPRQVLSVDYRPLLLSAPSDKIRRIEQSGVDVCFPLNFTKALSEMSAEDFMLHFLKEKLSVSTLLVGHDHRFGHQGNTCFEDYRRMGERLGMEVLHAQAFHYEGTPVSSSRIRRELTTGAVDRAAAMLGYPYTISGTVVHGLQNGRKMGFPTANLGPHCEFMQIPSDGVYSAYALIDGERKAAMLNVGFRPTFQGDSHRTIEAHILDFNRDIYFHELSLEFVDFIRPEVKFESPSLLARQLEKDREKVRETLPA